MNRAKIMYLHYPIKIDIKTMFRRVSLSNTVKTNKQQQQQKTPNTKKSYEIPSQPLICTNVVSLIQKCNCWFTQM